MAKEPSEKIVEAVLKLAEELGKAPPEVLSAAVDNLKTSPKVIKAFMLVSAHL